MQNPMKLLVGLLVIIALAAGSVGIAAATSNSGGAESTSNSDGAENPNPSENEVITEGSQPTEPADKEKNWNCRGKWTKEGKKGRNKGDKKDWAKNWKEGCIRADIFSIAASVLGKTVDEMKDAIKDGKLCDLLIAAGKVDEFKSAYLAELKSKLDVAVNEGTLTREQADEKYAAKKEKLDAYDGTSGFCGHKCERQNGFDQDNPSKEGIGREGKKCRKNFERYKDRPSDTQKMKMSPV